MGYSCRGSFLLKALAEKSRKDELALPQKNQSSLSVIPKVPSSLDDSLIRYARKHKFSEPRRDAGLGYLEYRNQLVQEREVKLQSLNPKKEFTQPRAETAPLPTQPAKSVQPATPPNNGIRYIDRFNEMMAISDQTGKTLQAVAVETQQGYVLKALGIPVEEEVIETKQEKVSTDKHMFIC